MSILLGILLTFLVFLVVVLIHELWHFTFARLTGMKVLEFWFGIPPKVFRVFRDRKGTDYTMNLLPIGGFVRIKWEDPTSLESLDPDSFSQKKWWARSVVLIAGVTFNFILAILIFTFSFFIGIAPIAPNFLTEKDYGSILLPTPETALRDGYMSYSGIVLTPLSGSIAERSWILPGDILLMADTVAIQSPEQFMQMIGQKESLSLLVQWTGSTRNITIKPQNKKVGMYIGYNELKINREYRLHYGLLASFSKSVVETYRLSYMTLAVLGDTFKNLLFPATPEDRKIAEWMLAGPIGMWAGFVSLVDIGVTWKMIMMIIAIISINLWVFNLLPFPALDGGRLVSTTFRALFANTTLDRHRFSQIENTIHAWWMVLLLGLSLLVAYFDISKFF